MMAFHPQVVVESLKCFNQKSYNYAYILKFPLNFYIEIDQRTDKSSLINTQWQGYRSNMDTQEIVELASLLSNEETRFQEQSLKPPDLMIIGDKVQFCRGG